MQISVSHAKAQLTELMRLAEAGEKIVLTRHGKPVIRLVPLVAARNRKARLAVLEAVRQAARAEASMGPGAAPSRDFLLGADGDRAPHRR